MTARLMSEKEKAEIVRSMSWAGELYCAAGYDPEKVNPQDAEEIDRRVEALNLSITEDEPMQRTGELRFQKRIESDGSLRSILQERWADGHSDVWRDVPVVTTDNDGPPKWVDGVGIEDLTQMIARLSILLASLRLVINNESMAEIDKSVAEANALLKRTEGRKP